MITFIDEENGIIWWQYKGDEISWNGNKYLYTLSEGVFDTIEDMDKFWESYFNTFLEEAHNLSERSDL